MPRAGVLDQLAVALGRRDEVPNQELARKLVRSGDRAAVAELAGALAGRNVALAGDALKTLYEIGYERPELVANHAEAFLPLLHHRNNRLVWGAMMALGTLAPLRPEALRPHLDAIAAATRAGSVITQDHGVRVIAALAAAAPRSAARARRFLLDHLRDCRSKDVPQRCESAAPAFSGAAAKPFTALLLARLSELTPPQARRVRRVLERAAGTA